MRWFITGAGSGIGAAIAAAALARGDEVTGVVRTDEAAARFAGQAPGRAHAAIADVTDRERLFTAVANAERTMGAIDVLLNNAGQVLESYVEEADAGAVRSLFEVNLIGPMHAIQAALPAMRARGAGRIINVSSGGGIVGVPSVGLYSASKFALEGMSEALAGEVGPLGIAVTIVEPGAFRTNLLVKSRTTIPTAIPDYEKSAGRFRGRLSTSGGREPGDPALLALAVLRIADSPAPPLRVALGDDAIGMALGKAASITADVEAWRAVGSGLAFPAG